LTNVFDSQLSRLEHERADGLSSQEILETLAELGQAFSEASLRKYVQLGLLPRSVRVGEKGKHRGSKGLYPVRVVRQILVIKEMLGRDFSIEQIREHFLFLQGELEELDQRMQGIFQVLGAKVMREPKRRELGVVRDLNSARGVGKDLIEKLRSIQSRLSSHHEIEPVREAAG
jgi:DNA-binding transcriptional MerR regulator